MKLLLLLSISTWTGFCSLVSFSAQAETILLGEGVRTLLPLRTHLNVTEHCTGVATLSVQTGGLEVLGKKQGRCFFQTTTQLKDGSRKLVPYQVLVLSADRLRAAETLNYFKQAQHWPDSLRIEHDLTHSRLLGKVDQASLYTKLYRELGNFEGLRLELNVPLHVHSELEMQINASLKAAGYRSARVAWTGQEWLLSGKHTLEDTEETPSSWVAAQYWPMKTRVVEETTGHPLFELEMEFHEMRTTQLQELGVEWPQAIAWVLGTAPGAIIPNLVYLGGRELGGSLQWSTSFSSVNQFSRLIAHPKLVCQSGKKVSFHSGGSFPIENKAFTYSNTQWKIHGLKVDIEPVWEAKTRSIQAKLAVGFSQPVARPKSDTPELFETKMETSFVAQNDEPMVLTGFTQRKNDEARTGLPWTARLPWIRWFTGKQQQGSKDTELVIRVRARVRRGGSST